MSETARTADTAARNFAIVTAAYWGFTLTCSPSAPMAQI